MALKISYNLYGKNLFIYSVILYSGNCTIDSNFSIYISENGRGFHGLYLVREQFQSDMYLVKKSKSISSTFLFMFTKG